MKYIVLQHENEEFFFQFPNHSKISHKNFAEIIKRIQVHDLFGNWTREFGVADVVSAGFVDKSGACFGHSESLDLKSREDIDTQLRHNSHGAKY